MVFILVPLVGIGTILLVFLTKGSVMLGFESAISAVSIVASEDNCNKFSGENGCFGSELLRITDSDLECLKQGKMLALLINDGEYSLFITN